MPMRTKEEQREYQRQWMKRRRQDFFKDKGCEICGVEEDLELHHVDPTQKVSHRIWSWSKERQETELAKCVILCVDCHTEESKKQIRQTEHGRTMYRNGCRCAICTKTEVDAVTAYKRSRD